MAAIETETQLRSLLGYGGPAAILGPKPAGVTLDVADMAHIIGLFYVTPHVLAAPEDTYRVPRRGRVYRVSREGRVYRAPRRGRVYKVRG